MRTPGSDHELVTKVNNAFTTTVRAGNAIIRTGVPPFTWWRGLKAREYLEGYFEEPEETAATIDPARAGRLHIMEVHRLIRFYGFFEGAAFVFDLSGSANTYTIEQALAYFSAAGRVLACHFGPAATATYCLPLTA